MTDRELDQIMIMWWPDVLRRTMAEGDDWLKGFVKSIARHAKRPSWHPTVKQEAIMRRLVAEVGSPPMADDDIQLIDDERRYGAA